MFKRLNNSAGVVSLVAILAALLMGQLAFEPRTFDDVTRPGTGVFEPEQSDTVDLDFVARDIWFLADGTVTFMCLDGTTGEYTGVAGGALPKGLFIKRILDTGTDLADGDMQCIK
jgi:hypothetical protein